MIPIRRASLEPPWRQIRNALKDRILSGILAPGDLLPEPVALARIVGCHPVCVSRAYASLVAGGWAVKSDAGRLAVSGLGEERRREAILAGLADLLDRALGQARGLGLGAAAWEAFVEERRTLWRQRSSSKA